MAELSATDTYATTAGLSGRAQGQMPLKLRLKRAEARAKRKALLLVLPLLVFILLSFVLPIGQLLWRSVYNDGFAANVPTLSAWFDENKSAAPDEQAYRALVTDLVAAHANKTAATLSTRINYDVPGSRSLFISTAKRAATLEAPYREAMIALNPQWESPKLWGAMRAASSPFTSSFYLTALDLQLDENGSITRVDEDKRIYVRLYVKTFALAAGVTLICLLLAWPVAHLLATLPVAKSNLLMIFVLLPFWTSLLVRTTSWMILLQEKGVVNDLLVTSGLVADENRLSMMYNQTGTIIAMVHILLPFMILPLYSVMRPIKPHYMRAARSLGASSWTAYRRVYFPQTLPGVGAGALLVFILALGYYITPALVGGASGQMISNMIAYHMQTSLNWSLAAAMSALLLAAVMALYWLYNRLVGIDNLKLG